MEPESSNGPIHDWQLQNNKLSERGKYILQTGLWSDCGFLVGIKPFQREFKAHKLILSMASPVFEKMFHSSLQEKSEFIEIPDVQPEVFANFLEYIYTDELRLESFNKASDLCYIGEKYMIPCLVRLCTSYIRKHVDHTSVCRAYEFARLFNQDHLIKHCKKIIINKTSAVLKHPNFLEAERSTVAAILDQDFLYVTGELELFQALQRWVDAECMRKGVTESEERRKLGEGLVGKVRYLAMNVKDVAEGPVMSGLLREAESFAVLLGAASSTAGVARSWPTTFDCHTTPRQRTPPILFMTNNRKLDPFYNCGIFKRTLILSISSDATLEAVRVMTQVDKVDSRGMLPHTYREDTTVWLEDEFTRNKLATGNFIGCSQLGESMEIGLVARLKANSMYRLGVELKAQGWYSERYVGKTILKENGVSLMLQSTCGSPIYALLISLNPDQSN